MGLATTADNMAQLNVMIEALRIYEDRTEARGQLWSEFGVDDKLVHLRSKVRRAQEAVRQLQEQDLTEEVEQRLIAEALDCFHDIINYAVFAIRLLRAGKLITEEDHDGE